jgi:hypothetical protein
MWRRASRFDRCLAATSELQLPPAVFKTCPWQPRELIETGLRQWLRCCAAALDDDQVIGMPSHAVDEAWHGFILCTARYQQFCAQAYGRFLHHRPVDDDPAGTPADSMDDQLRRTVVAWSLVGRPGEECVLWDLDRRVGVEHPWGLDPGYVEQVKAAIVDRLDR